MPIERNNNKETDLIIGNHFPTDNEETFAADATNQRHIASNLRDLTEQLSTARKLISESMTGQTAEQYIHTLEAQEKTFTSAAENHDTLAEGLEAAANNIAVTKANMNNVDDNFHQNMESLKEWGVSSGQHQDQMNAERTKLLDEAQESVRKGDTELSSFQQEAVNNLSNGRSVGSYSTFRLNEGATSTPLIDSRGAGFSGAGVASGLASHNPTSTGTTRSGGQSRATRYTSADSSTGLSSTALATSPRSSATNSSTGGFSVPSSITSQNQSPTNAPGNAPIMGMPSLGTGMPTPGAASQHGGSTLVGASAPAPGTANRRKKGSERALTSETILSEDWSRSKNKLVQVAATLWHNLASMGWENPVAVARIRTKAGVEEIVWSTTFGAAFVPDRLSTNIAKPMDVAAVSDKIRRQLILMPASFALDLWLQHTGVEVAERVVLAMESEKVAPGFDKINYMDLFAVDVNDLLSDAELSSDSFSPEKFDNSISKARSLAEKATFSMGEALQYASFALRDNQSVTSGDNTDLSAAGYMRQAIYDTVRIKLEAGDKEGYDFLIWQASQFDEIA